MESVFNIFCNYSLISLCTSLRITHFNEQRHFLNKFIESIEDQFIDLFDYILEIVSWWIPMNQLNRQLA